MFLKRIVFWICSILITFVSAMAQDVDTSFFGDHEVALVIYDRSSGEMINVNAECSARRLSPCSTFKIFNTLVGLELGLIKGADEPWYKWDSVERFLDGWNKNLTLREAFRVSAVPAYQILAREVGETRMKKYIYKIGYGSEDISAGIDVFWLSRPNTTSIMISADEQVDLLNKLLDGNLPFSEKNIGILRDIMLVKKTEKGALYGKTGSGMDSDDNWNLGWFVGFLEHDDNTYVFACNVTRGKDPSGKTARSIVANVFRSKGLL